MIEESHSTKINQKPLITERKKSTRGKKYPVTKSIEKISCTPLLSSIDDLKKNEINFACIRSKNERFNLNVKSELIEEAIQILHAALLESKNELLNQCRLEVITNAIINFIKSK